MNKHIKMLGMAILFVVIQGCAIHDGRPAPININVADEQKLKSVKHWEVVADDISNSIAKVALETNSTIYISPINRTSFGKVFPSYIRSKLLTRGIKVSSTEDRALRVEINLDTVNHVILNRYNPGTLAALAAGVLVLRDFTGNERSSAGSLATLLVGADAIMSFNEITKRPSTEVVITTSIQRETNFIAHRTDAYYIDIQDSTLFNDLSREIPVSKATK